MVSKGPETELHFSRPVRQIVTMLLVLALVAAGAYLAFPAVAPVFLANPYLNGFILLVFLIGGRRLFLAGSDACVISRLDRRLCPGNAGPRHDDSATPFGATGHHASATGADAVVVKLNPVHSRFRCHPGRRGAGNHALYCQYADFPRPSGDVLWSCHNRSGRGRHHSLARSAGRGRGGRGL